MFQDTAVTASQFNEETYGGTFQSGNDQTGRASLAELFEAEAVPHFQVLQRLALHLVRNQAQAEDLVQETFAQALKSFDRYEMGTNCRAWLCKIMFYKRSQWIRANSRFCQFDENESQFPVVAYSSMLPPDFMSEKLSLALFSLPEKFRQIVWLYEVEEFSYREIAARLDVPVGTVMSRLHRGREMLRVNFKRFADKKNAQKKYN
jgi:RNA polymerase sigma-70 factor (ECF subfamily)